MINDHVLKKTLYEYVLERKLELINRVIVVSTTNAEYIAVGSGATQTMWSRRMLSVSQHYQNKLTKIFCDNKYAIAITKYQVFYGRGKHIGIKCINYIHDLVKDKENHG